MLPSKPSASRLLNRPSKPCCGSPPPGAASALAACARAAASGSVGPCGPGLLSSAAASGTAALSGASSCAAGSATAGSSAAGAGAGSSWARTPAGARSKPATSSNFEPSRPMNELTRPRCMEVSSLPLAQTTWLDPKSVDGERRCEQSGGIGARSDQGRVFSARDLPAALAPVGHVHGRHRKLYRLALTGGERDTSKGLELLGRRVHARRVLDVELHHFLARHHAVVGHGDLDVQTPGLADAL